MITPATDEKLAIGLAVLRDLAEKGRIAPPPYSAEAIAEVCGVSPGTVQNIVHMARARAAARLLREPDLPVRLARKLSEFVSNP